ncbi:hypothetical protein E2F46_14495 [Luteimonas aestuarii]|uniref:DUF3619 family protein n=1 Tax=Luteimonas aestuarii TaxID=453837 RepID=A0A4R5TRY7_9GAMM|nr:hypothetical protein [Luteimonas aestuarii]TDK21746.1 hypothetical protein E2F46_14495 [Luteimonas aestuarii]
MTTPHEDQRFDDAMRALHARAVSGVSAGTMAQLHRRRHAALQGDARPRRWFGLPAAAAFASLLVVAIGLGFGLQTTSDAPATMAPLATAGTPAVEIDDAYAALDENPDFFLWLASSDANLLAME